MNLAEIEAINERTMKAVRAGTADVARPDLFPFYGFYQADIFDCPAFMMFTANDCPRALEIMYARKFEMGSMKLWCRLARSATGILDIGSHVGVYALTAAALRNDIGIHAFEPNPQAYARLSLHKALNGFGNIVAHPVAVGAQDAVGNFGWMEKDIPQISSGGRLNGKGRQIPVQVAKLDGSGLAAVLGERPLIKIDVEGGEMETFEGMKETLALKPDIILETFFPGACLYLNKRLLPMGYKVYLIRESTGSVEPRERLEARDPKGSDFNQFLSLKTADELAAIMA